MEIPRYNPLDVVARLTKPAEEGLKKAKAMGLAGVGTMAASLPFATVDTRIAVGGIIAGTVIGVLGGVETNIALMDKVPEMEREPITLNPGEVLDLTTFAEERSPAA